MGSNPKTDICTTFQGIVIGKKIDEKRQKLSKKHPEMNSENGNSFDFEDNQIEEKELSLQFEGLSLEPTIEKFEKSPKQENDILDVWKVIKLFFRDRGLMFSKIESYDYFLENTVRNVIQQTKPIQVYDSKTQQIYSYKLGNAYFFSPALTPDQCRQRNMSYLLSVHADVTRDVYLQSHAHVGRQVFPAQKIFTIPLMLKSKFCHLSGKTEEELAKLGECEYDKGGYYIINGNHRCTIVRERDPYNRDFIRPPPTSFTAMIEVRSVVINNTKPYILSLKVKADKTIVTSVPSFSNDIPIGVFFHTLGFYTGLWKFEEDTTQKMSLMICDDSQDYQVQDCIRQMINTFNAQKRDIYQILIGNINPNVTSDKHQDFLRELFQCLVLAHVPIKLRPFYLAYMIRKVILAFLGRLPKDDRDNFANRKFDTDGPLLEMLFRPLFEKYYNERMVKELNFHPAAYEKFTTDESLSKSIHNAMSTGNWGVPGTGYTAEGICQAMVLKNHMSAISHTRRSSATCSSKSTAVDIRLLHNSQWGITDPSETPEGEKAGIIKNLAILAHITTPVSEQPLVAVLIRMNVDEFDQQMSFENCHQAKVFLNGALIGVSEKPHQLLNKLKKARRDSLFHGEISLSYQEKIKEFHCYTDGGRCMRPLFACENGELLIKSDQEVSGKTWYDLLREGKIVYVDKLEEQTSNLALYPGQVDEKTHYCEIHPCTILGVCCSIVPFLNHNQGPRNIYSASMTKQAVGIWSTMFLTRFETTSYQLHYPQRALISTKMSEYLGYNELPSGINAIVAIMSQGWNVEDSIVMNKASIQRGLFVSTVYKVITEVEELAKKICPVDLLNPIETINRNYNYLKLGPNGIIRKGSTVCKGDVLIRKIEEKEEKGKPKQRHDISVVHRLEEEGFVDDILITTSSEGAKLVKVRLGFIRNPLMGSKFASVHAQKGTLGMIMSEVDLPFCADGKSEGIRPDIIINPHCIPSRMTIGQLIETVCGKASLCTGENYDGSPSFSEDKSYMKNYIDMVGSKLVQHGFQRHGDEMMICGRTGELLPCSIFIGPTYYRALTHFIQDKLSAQSLGPKKFVTGQPVNSGRKNGPDQAAIRFGQMEDDALNSHGAAFALNERMLESSDKYETKVCSVCGTYSQIKKCKCLNAELNPVKIPYPFKLLSEYVRAMGIDLKVETEPIEDPLEDSAMN